MTQKLKGTRDCFLTMGAFRLDNKAEVKIVFVSDKCKYFLFFLSFKTLASNHGLLNVLSKCDGVFLISVAVSVYLFE